MYIQLSRTLILTFLLFLPSIIISQIIFSKPLSPRIANYHIRAELNVDKKQVKGREILTWKNSTSRPVSELQFHLYMNAFRNSQSTFMKEAPWRIRRFLRGKKGYGGIDILDLQLEGGENLTQAIEFIHPDDENEKDSTVIRVTLPEPILPGDSISVHIEFLTHLPKIFARTGTTDDFFMVAQWFPKIGVWQENGQWNCHQFHANSEFFADFGVYDVKITLPIKYVVGATGIRLEEEKTDSLQTLTYRAEDVHDFAWTAWPNFLFEKKNFYNVEVTMLYAPENQRNIHRYFKAIQAAIEHFGQWYMPYPYPNFTIVDGPIYFTNTMGMEYPTLINCSSFWYMPEGFKYTPEEVTIHEFAHQYFYGILASNEFEEPWLDEGFTTYASSRLMDVIYGEHTSMLNLLGIKSGNLDWHRSDYLGDATKDIISKPSWEFKTHAYGTLVYDKPTVLLTTLERYLGNDVMNKIMKEYINRFKFKHPTTRDFINIVNEIAQMDMDWFFDQALFDSRILDYEVRKITNHRIDIHGDSTGSTLYRSEVQLFRNGDFIFPVEVEIVFANNDTVITTWDGKDRYHILVFEKPARLIQARIDPEQKVTLDVNWTNNSYTLRPNPLASLRHRILSLQILQTLMVFLSF